MSTTLTTELANLAIDLSDPNNTYFTTADLTLWINQACFDIARRAECLMQKATENATANMGTYTAPSDTIRVYQVDFSPNDPTQIYTLTYKGRQEMSSVWLINQTINNSYPLFFTTWSQPPSISVQVYPVPAQAGVFTFWYYREPVPVTTGSNTIDIPDGYEDVLRAYVRYCARRRAGDAMWQDDKALYEEGLGTLITNSRNWTDQAGQFSVGGATLPGWLYGGFGN